MDTEPDRAPLVTRTTEKLIEWAELLLEAAKYGKPDLVLVYDDVIREMGQERQRLHEERIIERNSYPPPQREPDGLDDRTTLPSPPPVPTIRSTRAAEPVRVTSSPPASSHRRRQKPPKRKKNPGPKGRKR